MIPKIETLESHKVPYGQLIILPGEGEVAVASDSLGLDDGNYLVQWIPLTEAPIAWKAIQRRKAVIELIGARGLNLETVEEYAARAA